jgi:hypothetical protein
MAEVSRRAIVVVELWGDNSDKRRWKLAPPPTHTHTQQRVDGLTTTRLPHAHADPPSSTCSAAIPGNPVFTCPRQDTSVEEPLRCFLTEVCTTDRPTAKNKDNKNQSSADRRKTLVNVSANNWLDQTTTKPLHAQQPPPAPPLLFCVVTFFPGDLCESHHRKCAWRSCWCCWPTNTHLSMVDAQRTCFPGQQE